MNTEFHIPFEWLMQMYTKLGWKLLMTLFTYLLTYLLTAHYASWHVGQQQKLSTPVYLGPFS